MSNWRRRAIEALPEQKPRFEAAATPMMLVQELLFLFEQCLRKGDRTKAQAILDLIRKYLGSRSPEVSTAAALGFVEHLAIDGEIRTHLPGLVRASEVRDWRDLLEYHSDPAVVMELEKACRTADLAR